ncbi:UbiD family decarboxylase [uncultured Desulfuromusa sp.]|uniref:UbiD family decarboxylase n=1 Tax=uncultured Desulfuromusa sp. TaxID=219183 RepID=UPI002AA9286A|nr:UbiD family decarboxylase [uncultured Desulfuromusa sp.]
MDVKEYLQKIEEAKELQTVHVEINPRLELAALCRREFAKEGGGQALLFNRVLGSAFPVVANLFGSEQRISLLLHSASLKQFSNQVTTLLQQKKGTTAERLDFPRKTFTVTDSELIVAPDLTLTDLPAIQSWPGEGGRYLNLAVALTEHMQTGQRNLGLYRAQIVGTDLIALNFSANSGAAEHFAVAAKEHRSLPISLIIGSDPALIWVAAAALPDNCDEFAFHDALFDQKLQLTPGLTQPLQVPANAEIVIEGEIIADQTVNEGPFGNHTGQYVTRTDCPLMQVTAIRYRPGAVLSTTVVGPPPSENVNLGKANEILLREMLKIDFPQISHLKMPLLTIFHGVALLSVKPQSAGKNKELLYALWENSALRRSPLLVLFDEHVNLDSLSYGWWRAVNCLKNQRIYNNNGKIGIDATGVNPSSLVEEDQDTRDLLRRRKDEYNQC